MNTWASTMKFDKEMKFDVSWNSIIIGDDISLVIQQYNNIQ